MADPDYIPLISGLIGALIGAGASLAGQMIQARIQAKRDRMKLIMETASADQRHVYDHGVKLNQPVTLYPLTAFVHYHAGLLDLLERDALTPEALKVLKDENRKVLDMLEAIAPRK